MKAPNTNPTRADLAKLKQRIEKKMERLRYARELDGETGEAYREQSELHRMNLAHVEDHLELRSLYDPPYRREMYGRMAQLQIATARLMAHYGGE